MRGAQNMVMDTATSTLVRRRVSCAQPLGRFAAQTPSSLADPGNRAGATVSETGPRLWLVIWLPSARYNVRLRLCPRWSPFRGLWAQFWAQSAVSS